MVGSLQDIVDTGRCPQEREREREHLSKCLIPSLTSVCILFMIRSNVLINHNGKVTVIAFAAVRETEST